MILDLLLGVALLLIWLIVGERTVSSMNYTSSRRWWTHLFLGPMVPIVRIAVRSFPMQFVLLLMTREYIVDLVRKIFLRSTSECDE